MGSGGAAALAERPEAAGSALSAWTIGILAACAAMSVANVYYAQPLLEAISQDLSIGPALAGGVISATQLGCALALCFVVPLGDILNRSRLIKLQLCLLLPALGGVAWAGSAAGLLLGMTATGLLGTAMTQGVIGYAAALASPEERGRIVGTVQSGVVIGLLLARTVAGIVSDLGGWRAVYLASAGVTLLMLALLSRILRPHPPMAGGMAYRRLLMSMLALLRDEPVLRVRGMLGLLMFAALGVFWSAMALPLSGASFAYTRTEIGAFGLVGMAGALAAARAGYWTDQGKGQAVTLAALLCLLASWPMLAGMDRMAVFIAGIILLDLGGQAIHVVNQGLILASRPEAQSRLVACYMLFYSAGSGLGAISSTTVYARFGWSGVCWLGAAISAAALAFWRATLPRH
ncbi:MFS transporter [Chromobacterium sp. IIBBL 290-4]|uniref:MFS transporter n=1 Tax=Chromobacterium sp. IIBBL 290-4 TaxID=2953890 RepID=UPI0020B7127D|nr:MFS transporter [Chromobacterium sp. IIBBL 290-4]UTH74921.1 MFS transporter [Chromobacterium sp. IIBBL 290-4]